MKTNKRKNILLASMLLGSVALSTVGFAAWVISQGDTKDQAGTITVDTVTDESHFVTVVANQIDESNITETAISFGAAAPKHSTEGWMSYEDQDNDHPEDLTAVIYFTVSNADKTWLTTAGNVTLELEAKTAEGKSGSYATAFASGLVGELPSTSNGGIKFETVTIDEQLYCKATITFKWGSKFTIKVGEEDVVVNPIDYYNAMAFTEANVEAAITMLKTTLPNALDGVYWKLTITTKA